MEYRFKAKSTSGEIIFGSTKASCERDVVLWLKDVSLVPLDIQQKKELKYKWQLLSLKKYFMEFFERTSLSEKVNFFRDLALLTSSGFSLAASIDILREQSHGAVMRRAVDNVGERINSGVSFSAAMADLTTAFDHLCVAFARAGEESGRLADNLTALAALLEARSRLRKKIISAMTYPMVVMFIAFVVFFAITAVVIPQFENAFSALNAPLPIITTFTFKMGRAVRGVWYLFPPALLLLLVLLFCLRRYESSRFWLDSLALRLPITGKTLSLAVQARSFSAMASLLNTGVPLPLALQLAGEVAANARIGASFERVREGALAGVPLNVIMRECGMFSPVAASMIKLGEATGKTSSMFKSLADNCEFELDERIKRLTSLSEPLLVVFVGVIVACLAGAIFMPVISIIESFI